MLCSYGILCIYCVGDTGVAPTASLVVAGEGGWVGGCVCVMLWWREVCGATYGVLSSLPSLVNLKRLIERLPACGKYSNLRKQLKIDMAGECIDILCIDGL